MKTLCCKCEILKLELKNKGFPIMKIPSVYFYTSTAHIYINMITIKYKKTVQTFNLN